MVNIPRIHCHSAFKHYEMFHNNQSSSYGNSIFNTTYNFNGGTVCGGGFFGGLLGGIGMGLGAGIMNFLSGGMNLFGGMMSGFPMMNMWGGGFPMMNMWGMGGMRLPWSTDGAGGPEKTNKKKDSSECDDPDRKKLADFNERELKIKADLEAKKSGSIDDLKNLYRDVVAAQKASKEDDNHSSTDTREYNTLLKRLKELADKNNLTEKDGELVEKETSEPIEDSVDTTNPTATQEEGSSSAVANPSDSTATEAGSQIQEGNSPAATATEAGSQTQEGNSPAATATEAGSQTQEGNQPAATDNAPESTTDDNTEFTIGAGQIKLKDIKTPDNIKGLTKQQAKALGKDNATNILAKFDITPNSEIKQNAGIEEVLLLLEVAQISVKVAYNEGDDTVSDHWIKGKISNVDKDENGKLSYKVDCSNDEDSAQGNKYTVKQQNETKFRFSIAESDDFGTGVRLADDNITFVDFEFESGHDSLYRNGSKYTTKLPR